MRLLLTAIAVAAFATQAQAISRYQTMSMSCDQVQEAVDADGAAILRWRSTRTPGLPLYGRYVSDSSFCKADEVAVFASVPTRDDRSCTVRKCEVQEFERFGRPRILIPGR